MGAAKSMGNLAMISKREYGGFVVGAIIFFLLSFALFKQVPPTKNHMDLDSGAYVQAANFLLRDGSFAILKQQPYYELGYPLFLAGIKKIGDESVWFAVAVQVLLAWLITLLIWRITGLLFNRRAAWIAYAFAIMHVGFLVFAQFFLTEILLVLLLCITIERLLVFLQTRRLSVLAAAGFTLGLSCTVKAVAVLFLLPLALFVGFFSWRQEMLKKITVLVAMFMLSYGTYVAHNQVTFIQHARSSMAKVNLFYWYYPRLRAEINGTDSYEEQRSLQQMPFEDIPSMLVRDVLGHPGKAFIALGKNWLKTLLGLYTSNVKLLVDNAFVSGCLSFFSLKGSFIQRVWGYISGHTEHAWIKGLGCIEAALLLFRYILVPFGLWALCARKRWWDAAFIVLYLGYFVGISGHDGCARFRMMIDMIILALAAGGYSSLHHWWLCKLQMRDIN